MVITWLSSGSIRCLPRCTAIPVSKRSRRRLFRRANSERRQFQNELTQLLRRAEAAQRLQDCRRLRRNRLVTRSNRNASLSVFRNSELDGPTDCARNYYWFSNRAPHRVGI